MQRKAAREAELAAMSPRQRAKARNERTYPSPKPCKRGHTGPHWTNKGNWYSSASEHAHSVDRALPAEAASSA